MPLLEVVTNISEGRRPDIVEALAATFHDAADVTLLDHSSDVTHHRSVFTAVGEPAPLIRTLLTMYAAALTRIDLRQHQGVHPRVGAVDVTPFVPLTPDDLPRCVDAAHALGHEVADRFGLPVFFYEDAARAPHRRPLEALRRGGLSGLTARLADARWTPDCGPSSLHPTGGVTVIGARLPLVAFNVQLATDDLGLARRIARAIRTSGGGLPAVKAIGVATADPHIVQVSMNLVDYRRTSVLEAFEAVSREAARAGIGVHDSEIIGLAPSAALLDVATTALRLRAFKPDRLLECRLQTARSTPPPAEAT